MFKSIPTTGRYSFRGISEFLSVKFSSLSSASTSHTSGVDGKKHSFSAAYLMEQFGFSEKRAVLVSKNLKFETSDKPDGFISLMKKHGFTDSQVSAVVKASPRILVCRPGKSILPKIDFFRSLGFKDDEICKILSSRGRLIVRSLDSQIIPSITVLREILGSYSEMVNPIERCSDILTTRFQSVMLPNIEVMKDVGIPEANILNLLKHQPRVFITPPDQLRRLADKLEKLGVNPREKVFVRCLWRMSSIDTAAWACKVALYEKWGCSEDQVWKAFTKHVCVMAASEEKISAVFKFLVQEMGYDSSCVLNAPGVISQSMKKTIVPRISLHHYMLDRGLVTKKPSLSSLLKCHEEMFLERFVKGREEAPELLEMYQKLLKGSMAEDGKTKVKLKLD